jgi:hypothetical protein
MSFHTDEFYSTAKSVANFRQLAKLLGRRRRNSDVASKKQKTPARHGLA